MNDAINNANGLRSSTTNLAQLPVLTFSSTAGNQPPAITPIPDLALYQSQVSAEVPFTVVDDMDLADWLYVWATSDAPAVINPGSQIEFLPYGTNRWLKVTAGTQVGTARITVHVHDIYALENVTSFNVTVLPDPLISSVAHGSTLKNTPQRSPPLHGWLGAYRASGIQRGGRVGQLSHRARHGLRLHRHRHPSQRDRHARPGCDGCGTADAVGHGRCE